MPFSYRNVEEKAAGARGLVDIIDFDIGGLDMPEMRQLTVKEIVLGESLLTPGLQTTVTLQSLIYLPSGKNFDKFKNKPISFTLERDGGGVLPVNQQVYRLDNRDFQPVNTGQTEEFSIHACDQTQIEDAKKLVSKSWSCERPSSVVEYVLKNCAGAKTIDVESADPARDYIAENIHPFQVVGQQCNVGLADGSDPSFVHFMTYENGGTHCFKSLKQMTQQSPVATFKHSETGKSNDRLSGYANPEAIVAFMFPCDFDYLSDLLNGVDENGKDMNTLAIFNPVTKSMSQLGNQMSGCGMGGFNFKQSVSNNQSNKQQQACNLDVEHHLLKRQARMALLERDKIALRMTVPWNANLHASKVIKFEWTNKYGGLVYGSGTYLISSISHAIRLGGFSTTTMDCVSTTVGGGEV
mgnify:CR=1 FL=1